MNFGSMMKGFLKIAHFASKRAIFVRLFDLLGKICYLCTALKKKALRSH